LACSFFLLKKKEERGGGGRWHGAKGKLLLAGKGIRKCGGRGSLLCSGDQQRRRVEKAKGESYPKGIR